MIDVGSMIAMAEAGYASWSKSAMACCGPVGIYCERCVLVFAAEDRLDRLVCV